MVKMWALFMLAVASPAVFAGESKITFVKGEVSLIRGSATLVVKSGQKLEKSDVVKTAAGALAVLELEEGSRIKMSELSELALSTLGDSPDIKLEAGSAFSKVAKRREGQHFRLHSRSATMGVRGTEFFAAYGRARNEARDFWMCVHEGNVEIQGEGEKESQLVKEGEGIFMARGSEPTAPRPYKWTHGLNWNMDPSLGEIESKVKLDNAYTDLLSREYD